MVLWFKRFIEILQLVLPFIEKKQKPELKLYLNTNYDNQLEAMQKHAAELSRVRDQDAFKIMRALLETERNLQLLNVYRKDPSAIYMQHGRLEEVTHLIRILDDIGEAENVKQLNEQRGKRVIDLTRRSRTPEPVI